MALLFNPPTRSRATLGVRRAAKNGFAIQPANALSRYAWRQAGCKEWLAIQPANALSRYAWRQAGCKEWLIEKLEV